jgi:poly(A)-specific ribonuclease
VVVIYRNQNDLLTEQKKQLQTEASKLDDLAAIHSLFDIIRERRIPLIGHNCFYDLLHLFQLHENLPDDVGMFKRKIREIIPKYIYDTRIIQDSYGDSASKSLKGLIESYANSFAHFPFQATVAVESGYALPESFTKDGQWASKDLSHDAGYDALLTALLFLMQKSRGANLESLVNKVKLTRSAPSVLDLALPVIDGDVSQ